jgi:hypothetical protein
MQPLYLALIEDLGRFGLSPGPRCSTSKEPVRCRGCGALGRAVVSVKWGARAREPARPRSSPWTRNTATPLI